MYIEDRPQAYHRFCKHDGRRSDVDVFPEVVNGIILLYRAASIRHLRIYLYFDNCLLFEWYLDVTSMLGQNDDEDGAAGR